MSSESTQRFRTLKPEKIIDTQRKLRDRINKRFPDSGLTGVATELLTVAEEAAKTAESIRRPNIPLRVGVALLLVGVIGVFVAMGRSVRVQADLGEAVTLVQFLEAAMGTLVFAGLAALFLWTLEERLKRRRALKAIHELRAIAHVVDMHQLTKEPEGLLRRRPVVSAADENQTTKTLFELNRYLNYCSELLAIISKVAAVYVQKFPDGPTVSAVDQVETLCTGLARKIWQKLIVLDKVLDEQRGATVVPG